MRAEKPPKQNAETQWLFPLQGWCKQSTIKTTDRMWPRTQWDHLLCYIVENFTKEKLGHSNKQKGERERERCLHKRRDEFLVQALLKSPIVLHGPLLP